MVQWAAGDRITASKLSTTRLTVVCDLALTVTTTATDISGLTTTFSTTRDNVDVSVVSFLDVEALTATPDTGLLVGELVVDGNAQSSQILWRAGAPSTVHAGARNTPGQSWTVTLATAGSHTFKMRAARILGTANHMRVNVTHSTMSLTIEDNV